MARSHAMHMPPFAALPRRRPPGTVPTMIQPAIDAARLWSDLMTLASIGALPHGGCDRLALTDADAAARHLFAHWCREAGLSVTIDAMGNMFALREGADPALEPVLLGSHLDTQQPGGKFDGPLGVLAALECVRALDRAGVTTRRPVIVVNWTNEEGARFAPGLMGAAVHAGVLPLAEAHAAADRAGRRVGEELRRIGFLGQQPGPAMAHAYLELHIEQGDRLQNAGKTIGIVEGTENNLFLVIDCWGENAHAQATPMRQRRNALVAAAALITEAERIGQAYAPEGSAGIAALDVLPNNRINIPHHVRLSFSATHPTRDGIEFDPRRPRRRRGRHRRPDRNPHRTRARTRPPERRFRPGADPRGRDGSRRSRLSRHAPAKPRRPRRRPHGARLPHPDDLRPLQGRHQPQRAGGHDAERRRRGCRSAAARPPANRRLNRATPAVPEPDARQPWRALCIAALSPAWSMRPFG